MAIVLNGSTQYGSYAGAVKASTPLTMVGWIKAATPPSTALTLLDLHNSGAAANRHHMQARTNDSGNIVARAGQSAAASSASTSTGYSSGVWHQFVVEFISATSRTARLDDAGMGSDSTSITPSGINLTVLGANGGSGFTEFWQGKLAAVAIYNVADLSAGERADLLITTPDNVRASDLLAYWPLISDANDVVGSFNFTLTGSPTFDSDYPDILPLTSVGLPSRRDRRRLGYVDMRLG